MMANLIKSSPAPAPSPAPASDGPGVFQTISNWVRPGKGPRAPGFQFNAAASFPVGAQHSDG